MEMSTGFDQQGRRAHITVATTTTYALLSRSLIMGWFTCLYEYD